MTYLTDEIITLLGEAPEGAEYMPYLFAGIILILAFMFASRFLMSLFSSFK